MKSVAKKPDGNAQGGLPVSTRRALEQIAAGRAAKDVAVNPAKPGTHIVRDWNGRTYRRFRVLRKPVDLTDIP